MKVILMGYMGSGKSVIGRLLSNTLTYDFIDLDAYIEMKEDMTIPEIFERKGEVYFRKKEYDHLKELLSSKDDFVLSLGGGTPCYGNNLEIIKNSIDSSIFYLKASVQTLFERLVPEKENRPLISQIDTKEELIDYLNKHLFERGFYYNQADFVINVDGKNKQDVIEEVVLNLF
ncbi:MAG: shikimate kinase [Bacteroidia bacterium]|nr:shikimate kinase [Bacteroidia bacterium]MBT8311138.1 shikimate kinase [Bacteroidia bacterium]NND11813.1 shikimate kinase [Flavobacteriaceae bacterium]NNK27275.1 shikimate kinase [Flavobacteriaceae bacterium]